MFGLLFESSFTTLAQAPETILGDTAKLVRHLAVYDQPHFWDWFRSAFLRNFVGSLESFTLLDSREWEDATRHSKTEQNPGGVVGYSALREVMKPGAFRPENLVRVSLEELRGEGNGAARLRAFVESPPFHWLQVGERKIDSRVMRYPYVAGTMAKRRNARRIGMLKRKLMLIGYPKIKGEKRSEKMSREWRHLRTSFTRSFRNIVRFFKGGKEGV